MLACPISDAEERLVSKVVEAINEGERKRLAAVVATDEDGGFFFIWEAQRSAQVCHLLRVLGGTDATRRAGTDVAMRIEEEFRR